jgi:hypothetical protein
MESWQPIKILKDKKKILLYMYNLVHCNNRPLGKFDATRRHIVRLTVNCNVKLDPKEIRYEVT